MRNLTARGWAQSPLGLRPPERTFHQLLERSGHGQHLLVALHVTGVQPHAAEDDKQRLDQSRLVDVGGDLAAFDRVADDADQKLPAIRTDSLSVLFHSGCRCDSSMPVINSADPEGFSELARTAEEMNAVSRPTSVASRSACLIRFR